MISFFARKHPPSPIPLPPLDPPPDASKRLEKERAWLHTIRSTTNSAIRRAGTGARRDGVQIVPPRGIQHIVGSSPIAGSAKRNGRDGSRRSRQASANEQEDALSITSSGNDKKPLSFRSAFSVSSTSRSDINGNTPLSDPPPPRPPLPLYSTDSSDSHLSPITHRSSRAHPPYSPKTRTPPSSTPNTKTLAGKLQELESAHTNGLMDESEYRILRANIFEKEQQQQQQQQHTLPVSSGNSIEAGDEEEYLDLGEGTSTRLHKAENTTGYKTGTLLQLPRLATGVQEVSAIPPVSHQAIDSGLPPVHPPPSESLLLAPSSFSLLSRSRLSLRPSKTSASKDSRSVGGLGSLFKRHASSPASQSHYQAHNDAASVASLPTTMRSIHSQYQTSQKKASSSSSMKRGKVPKEWKELQEHHRSFDSLKQKEALHIHKGEQDLSLHIKAQSDIAATHSDIDIGGAGTLRLRKLSTSRSDPAMISTARRAQEDKLERIVGAAVSIPAQTGTDTNTKLPSSGTSMQPGLGLTSNHSLSREPPNATFSRTPTILKRYRSDSKLTTKWSSSSTTTPTAQLLMGNDPTLSSFPTTTVPPPAPHSDLLPGFSVSQPGDDTLSSAALQQAITTARAEQARLLLQFSDLEQSLRENLGISASASLPTGTSRKSRSSSLLERNKRTSIAMSSSASAMMGASSHLSKGSIGLSDQSMSVTAIMRRPSIMSSYSHVSSSPSSLSTTASHHYHSHRVLPVRQPQQQPFLDSTRPTSSTTTITSAASSSYPHPHPYQANNKISSTNPLSTTCSSPDASSAAIIEQEEELTLPSLPPIRDEVQLPLANTFPASFSSHDHDDHVDDDNDDDVDGATTGKSANQEIQQVHELQKKKELVKARYDARLAYLEARLREELRKDKLRR